VTDLNDLMERASAQLGAKRPFVLYAKPGGQSVTALFQKDGHTYGAGDFSRKGFVFANFAFSQKLLVPDDISDIATADIIRSEGVDNVAKRISLLNKISLRLKKRAGRKRFEKLAIDSIRAIRRGKYSKIVISRKEIVAWPTHDWQLTFNELLRRYPDAYRYFFYHPAAGQWMGASPERLLRVDDRQFATVALAGTQRYEGRDAVTWGEKEKAEQLFVTDYILAELRDKVSEIEVSQPYTARAGNLLHIKTDITGTLAKDAGLFDLVKALHPTPAVCGLPKHETHEYLLASEGYDREFYSGFFGAIGPEESELFVNLRCMKIKPGAAEIFVGCGITRDSNPILEYAETVNKSMTMKNILHPKPLDL